MEKLLRESWIFIKYTVVGVLGTLIDVGSLYIFIEYAHLHLLVATTLSFLLAVINNFVLNKYWTFQNTGANIRKQFIKFFIVSIIGLILTWISMSLLVYVFLVWYILAKLITSVIVLCWNFLGNKLWTFKDTLHSILHLDHFSCEVSIIIPAYNEEKRIIPTIEKIHTYFTTKGINHEIVVVDDGSEDATTTVVERLRSIIPHLSIVSYQPNRGKGYAVKTGVEHCHGRYILFTDADNSTPIEEFDTIYPHLPDHEVVIGSRYTKGSDIKIKQPTYRIMLGRLGNKVIRWFLLEGIDDTQCGFKAFQHAPAKEIFGRMRTNRFGFDMEVLAIARLLKYDIVQVPVSWYNSPDSRVRPIKDSLRTLKELIMIKLNLWGGRYH